MNFFIGASSTVLVQAAGVLAVWVVMRQVPTINGWTFDEILLVYGLLTLAKSINHMFADNLWTLGRSYIRTGTFDRFLVRPIDPLFHLLADRFCHDGIGNFLVGVALVGKAAWALGIEPGLANIVYLAVAVVSGGAIFDWGSHYIDQLLDLARAGAGEGNEDVGEGDVDLGLFLARRHQHREQVAHRQGEHDQRRDGAGEVGGAALRRQHRHEGRQGGGGGGISLGEQGAGGSSAGGASGGGAIAVAGITRRARRRDGQRVEDRGKDDEDEAGVTGRLDAGGEQRGEDHQAGEQRDHRVESDDRGAGVHAARSRSPARRSRSAGPDRPPPPPMAARAWRPRAPVRSPRCTRSRVFSARAWGSTW